MIVCAALLLALATSGTSQPLPGPFPNWTGPFLDPLQIPYGGSSLAENVSHSLLYRAVPDIGTYNMAAMLDYLGSVFLAYWKNSPQNEDQPGQRVLFSYSVDGQSWAGTDGNNIMFPNMSTSANPAALFAEPVLHINGRFYAAASPKQFCLYPTPFPSILLLRSINASALTEAAVSFSYKSSASFFGPVFWAAATVPAGFEEASALNGILTLGQTDAMTQVDVAALSNTSLLPCAKPGSGSLKCEAVANGYLPAAQNFEVSHYTTLGGRGEGNPSFDVMLMRSPRGILNLQASVRNNTDPSGAWVGAPNVTNIPDDNANLNAGELPGGKTYLLSNAMPNLYRDPLFLSTSSDGFSFNATVALTTCYLPIYTAPDQPFGCFFRYNGGSKQSGCQYPQGLALTVPGLEGFWAIFALNKEDIWILHAPFSSLP